MKQYKVKAIFVNLDNSLYTDEQAAMFIDIEADDEYHAHMLAKLIMRTYQADKYELVESNTKVISQL